MQTKIQKKPLIVVFGPTASGKTDLSLKLAKKFNGEIISTDSRQIYKGMNIATDIIPPKERQSVPHHLLAITTPDKPLTLEEYKALALKKIQAIHKRGKIPILVGGTGLYISAIIENYTIPKVAPDKKLRQKLQKEAEKHGSTHLHERLAKIDPKAAVGIHPNNLRYVIRALEINQLTGKNKSDLKKDSNFDLFLICLKLAREKLYERINLRVDRQIKRGLVSEVKRLLKRGYDTDLPAMSSLGVKEIIPYIEGKMPLEQCVEILKRNTRRYAKRQMTWFRRYDKIRAQQ